MIAKPKNIHGVFKPDFIAKSVDEINFIYLKKQGIKAVMIDLDGTVVNRGEYEVSDKIHKVLKKQNLQIYIATNRPKSKGLKNLKHRLNASGVIHPKGIVGKPFAHYYKKSLQILGLKNNQVAMIGDRYIQDIYGANRAGMTTIKIHKLGGSVNTLDKLLSDFEHNHTLKISDKYKPIKK